MRPIALVRNCFRDLLHLSYEEHGAVEEFEREESRRALREPLILSHQLDLESGVRISVPAVDWLLRARAHSRVKGRALGPF
jgi:hypothetical protein